MARPAPRDWMRPLLPAALVVAGVVVGLNLISFAFGVAPLATLRAAAAGTWGTPYGVGQVLFKATPLVLTGLAFEVGFRAGLFNIGAEGQLALGSLAAGWVGARLPGRGDGHRRAGRARPCDHARAPRGPRDHHHHHDEPHRRRHRPLRAR